MSTAALHFDDRERRAAAAALSSEADRIVQPIAQQRLHVIAQVCQQHGMRRVAGRHRARLPIDRLEHEPVVIDVQALVLALPRDREELGGTVVVAQRTGEGAAHQGTLRLRELLAAQPDLRQAQLQVAVALELRQGSGATGVGDQHRRCVRLQGARQLRQGHLHREGLHARHQPARRQKRGCGAQAPYAFDADRACEMPTGGPDVGKASPHAPDRKRNVSRRCPAQAQRVERLVGRQAVCVLHEDAGRAAGARRGPDQVLAEEGIGDVGARQERLDGGALDGTVGGPFVEPLHQLGPADRLEQRQIR